LVFQCFQSLRTYGKEPEQLGAVNGMFQMVLAEYPYDKIKGAFSYFLRHNNEMPTPADIVNIIERGGKPPLERSVYVSIQKKPKDERSSDEWAYCREYENFILTGKLS
jgi:hypothetical protein